MYFYCNISIVGGGGGGQGGDWNCDGCGFSNFASRFKCKQCNNPKAGGK